MDDLAHEVRELRSEIARHHRDFHRIVDLLDAADREELSTAAVLHAIRNIVG